MVIPGSRTASALEMRLDTSHEELFFRVHEAGVAQGSIAEKTETGVQYHITKGTAEPRAVVYRYTQALTLPTE